MSVVNRGFRGRRTPTGVKLPPGQYLTEDFPVLRAGSTPRIDLAEWWFTITTHTGEVQAWSWQDLLGGKAWIVHRYTED